MNATTRTLIICCGISIAAGFVAGRTTRGAPLAYTGGTIAEDFNYPKLAKQPDGLSATFPTAGLPGWASDESNYIVMDGTTITGALYSFGTSAADDRALGSIASSAIGVVFYGLELRNDTLQSLSGFNLSYTGEQWRETTPPRTY